MRPQFKVQAHENKTLLWWISRRSKIDMDPPYQRRGRLWSDSDKAYLIDSILNGFDIPKLYMADFTWGDSTLNISQLPYAIIDGKQRLEAIFDFYDGDITLNDDFEYIRNPQLKIGGLAYKDLKQNYTEIAEEFDNFNLNVMSVMSNSTSLINNMFVRLNRSKPLTGAEIRNAMSGPAPTVIRSIAGHEFFTTNVNFSIRRGADLNAAAKILMFEYNEKLMETKKVNLDEFVEKQATRQAARNQLELAGRRAVEVLDNMTTIFLPKDHLLSSAGVFPVYYWLVRSLAASNFSRLREFLVRVEEERKAVLQLVARDPQSKAVEQELVQLNGYYRSPNDAASYEGRFRIFRSRFLDRTSPK